MSATNTMQLGLIGLGRMGAGLAARLIMSGHRVIGYDVTYREFTGGHVIPVAFAREALAWVIGGELVSPGYWLQNGQDPNIAGP